MTAKPNDGHAGRSSAMLEYSRRLCALARGISSDDVRALLGAPDAVRQGADCHGPSATFVDLGLHVEFGESGADEVWAYRDPYRPRRTTFIAFRGGQLCASWRDTVSAGVPNP